MKRPSRSYQHKMRVSSNKAAGTVLFEGLKPDEVDMLLSMLQGAGYVTGNAGRTRLTFVSKLKEVQSLFTDEELFPFWRKVETSILNSPVQLRFSFMHDVLCTHGQNVGLYVHDICGYQYTQTGYRKAAKSLEKCGFHWLRSKRNKKTGTFTELWYLPDVVFAKGALGTELSTSSEVIEKLRKAVDFLKINVNPKRIDIVKQ